ncbi:MAG: hypothetical protein DWC02_07295 [Candidatus Poseidoniales archaeon]|nr:MAG: hypothetical protein DWC02_07295 [Candidatus Poseidoniales archaeon]
MESLRIVLMGKDFELRLVSLVVRARELADDVILLDLGSSDETKQLAKKIDCRILEYGGNTNAPEICKFLQDDNPQSNILIVKINDRFKLRDLPLLVNRARENWDVHMSFITGKGDNSNPQEVAYEDAEFSHLAVSLDGLSALSESNASDVALELESKLKVRVLHSKPSPKVQQRESLATASKFAQLFYWMLESRHPLLLFGIPGIVLFLVGYNLSGNVLDSFNEWNQTSISVGLAVIAVTLIGLFAMMVGLILYIMGKQVKQIQSQYNHWPKDES